MILQGKALTCIRGERVVFADLDFAVETGDALLLTGPNGTGKTSFLRLVAGLLRRASGELLWNETPVDEDPEAYHAALRYVGHQEAIKGILSVEENLSFWSRMFGGGAVTPALAQLDLDHLADIPGRFLSSGQRRRLALARLLVGDSRLWLLDEPTVGLDTASVTLLEQIIAAHRNAGGMVIAATHIPLQMDGARELRFGQS